MTETKIHMMDAITASFHVLKIVMYAYLGNVFKGWILIHCKNHQTNAYHLILFLIQKNEINTSFQYVKNKIFQIIIHLGFRFILKKSTNKLALTIVTFVSLKYAYSVNQTTFYRINCVLILLMIWIRMMKC